jgi:hypothetical protein
MAKEKDTLVPYDQVSPGFEAAYTGETSSKPVQKCEGYTTRLYSDEDGNLIGQWCTIPWTFPNEEGQWPQDAWDDTVQRLHEMQSKLGPLTDSVRKLRAHITSLIPCDSGLPTTVDELLFAVARGKLEASSFKNGCLCTGLACEQLKGSQPRHGESMRTIHAFFEAYLAGKSKEHCLEAFPKAAGFINRSFDWLGAVSQLSTIQRKMLDRMLLMIEYFAKASRATGPTADAQSALEEADLQELEALGQDLFSDENGRGARLDAEIAEQAGLPKIHPQWNPEYATTLTTIEEPAQKQLYAVCCAIAAGVQSLCDCHHNTFRYIEGWVHGIGTGRLSIPTRQAHAEKQRLGRLLFGYALGLDRWLVGAPMQFLLLDLGHVDLGFDPRNEILRVYACLGEEVTAVKEWLAACLWYSLVHNEQGGLIQHTDLMQACEAKGIVVDEWIRSMGIGR